MHLIIIGKFKAQVFNGFSGSLVLNYLQSDVVGDEPNYLTARLMVPGTTVEFLSRC